MTGKPPSTPTNIAMVVFDWGGVILRHCRSWKEGCAEAGLPHYPDLEAAELVASRRVLHNTFQRGGCTPEHFLSTLRERSGSRYTEAELSLLHDRWLLTEYADVDTIIDDLHAANVQTALLSNTNHLHWRRHLGPHEGGTGDYPTARKLKHRYASHLMGLAKPDPAIYAAFEGATGIPGPQLLFFDDLAENCTAAATRGWKTVIVDHTQETAPQIRAALDLHGVLRSA